MRAALAGSILAATSIGLLFACDKDDPADPSTAGADAAVRTGDETDDLPPDTGEVKRAPTGCELHTTGLKSGRKVESVARGAGVSWTNANGVLAVDNDFATITLGDGQESAELKITDFDLGVPEKAEMWGIVVEVKRQTRTDGGIIRSGAVNVELTTPKVPSFKFDNDRLWWPTKIVGTHEYGQEVDTWGVDLYPSDVNAATFAAKIWIRKGPDGVAGPVNAAIESVRVAMWYCLE